MRVGNLSYEEIESIEEACDRKDFTCENCKYRFEPDIEIGNNKIGCICDVLHLGTWDFDSIDELIKCFNLIANKEIGE